MWRSKPSKAFAKKYKRIRKSQRELADKIDEALEFLLESDRPELHGVRKHGELRDYYAWEFGRECRLLYSPNYEERIIKFSRVCSHKEVY